MYDCRAYHLGSRLWKDRQVGRYKNCKSLKVIFYFLPLIKGDGSTNAK